MIGIFKKKKEEAQKALPENGEFFTPSKYSLKEALEEIQHIIRTYYAGASEEAIDFIAKQITKIYPWTKYYRANRASKTGKEDANLFDHIVKTVIILLKNYSTVSSFRIHQDQGINYSLGEKYKWEEVFEATIVAIYHDVGKIFSQNLAFVSDDGYAYKYRYSFSTPPDKFFSIIVAEDGVRFVDFMVERAPSAFKNHPMLSAIFFAKYLSEEELAFLGERYFYPVLYFIANHHMLDTATLDRPAINNFLEADRLAAVEEKSDKKTQISSEEAFEELRMRILKLKSAWNRPTSGIFTLEGDNILLSTEFVANFDKEVLGEYKGEVSILGILKLLGITMTTFSSGIIKDKTGKEIAGLKKGGIIVPARELFTENEIATKITVRYTFVRT